METIYVIMLDFVSRVLNIIELTQEEIKESEQYEDFEDFLSTVENKYGFTLENCAWMTTDNLETCIYKQ